MKRRKTIHWGNLAFDAVNALFMLFLVTATLYPFVNTLAVSLNESLDTVRGGIYLFPRVFTLRNYVQIFNTKGILTSTIISVLRTVSGSLLCVGASIIIGYVLSRQNFVLRKILTRFFVLTMYFSGGLIPVFLTIRGLGLTNNFLVYILPGMVSGFTVIVMRSYIETLPEAFVESAHIDGASEMVILLRIILPLCMPVVATITLFVAVWQWNAWFDTFLYNSSNQNLSTLQYELQKVLQSVSQLAGGQTPDYGGLAAARGGANKITPTSTRAAMTIVAVMPIILVYPFLQRYFVTGITLGGVKG